MTRTRPDTGSAAVAARIADDDGLRGLLDAVRTSMAADAAHDLAHCLRVADWTLHLLREVDLADPSLQRVAIAAALLHDVVNIPKSSPDRAQASARSADVARTLMPPHGFTQEEAVQAAQAILDHSFSRGAVPTTPLGRALQDADRLEALGALGIMRCIATGATSGAAFFDTDDPWARDRPLDDRRFAIDHFQVKLLRLPPTLLTAGGRAEAERRVGVMLELLRALGAEIGVRYEGIGA